MTRGLGWDAFGFGFGPRAWARSGRRRRRQWFESGDMKYVILKLLQDKPRHGYEVMKELEERMHGCYSPSPGTVYPTLQWLEDEGLVTARDVDGKKVYEVDDIFERVREAVDRVAGGGMVDVNRALGRVVKAVYRAGWKVDEAARKRVAELLAKAAEEIEGLAN